MGYSQDDVEYPRKQKVWEGMLLKEDDQHYMTLQGKSTEGSHLEDKAGSDGPAV